MAALAPGDPKLISMIVNHLKNQGLFDQFRRDCLADVDTKPAYQNLRQRVDNFVSNHLASHTWSPHLNKNQLRNSLRQMVLQSGMLEAGVDRIISQVVDPKINHIFRPQVEKAVHEFLETADRKEEPASVNISQNSEKQEPTTPGTSSSCPNASKANDALSILDTITSLNQEASAARSTVENSFGKNYEKNSKKTSTTEIKSSFDLGLEQDHIAEDTEKIVLEVKMDDPKFYSKSEGSINVLTSLKDFEDRHENIETVMENIEDLNERNDKRDKDIIKNEQLSKNDRKGKRKDTVSVRHISGNLTAEQAAKENLKKEYFLEDSDFEGLSDITVSSVHTSDLSSFEEEEEEEEEGEVSTSESTDEVEEQSFEETDTNLESNAEEQKEGKARPGRHPYVHKPFLYSKYYNDSDDEETVVQHRQSVAKEKAERLLRRQWNRERIEDNHKQSEIEKGRPQEIQRNEQNLQTVEKDNSSNLDVETNSRKMLQPTALISKVSKAALKEQKILEKKVALRRKRKGDLRTLPGEIALHQEDRKRKREQPEEFKMIKNEFIFQNKEKPFTGSTLKDSKNAQSSDHSLKSIQILSEFSQSNGESSNHLKIDDESCQKQPRNNDSNMSGLEISGIDQLDGFGFEENLKDSSRHKDEMRQVKHSEGELVEFENDFWRYDIPIDAEQKLGTSLEENQNVMINCHQVIHSNDSKTRMSSTNSAELSIVEQSQDVKSKDHSKLKEEKGKEKKYVAEGSLPKSKENTQEDAKSHEKNKEKRNESECTWPKFKENSQDDLKSSEKGKEKRNDSENPCSKLKENMYEDAKSREKKSESESGRTKSRENSLDDKGQEKSKDKKYMSERSRSVSKECLQEDVKGKEGRGESGNLRSKSKEKIHDDTRSHEKIKENQNESGSIRSKSRETVQEDVRNKDKRKNFENSRSRSKEEIQEDKSREKRIEKRRESESSLSKSREKVDGSRSKTKQSIELLRSKSKEDNEYNQKGMEKRHDSETTRLKLKEHSEIIRLKSREKLQGDVPCDEQIDKRRDSETTRPKSKDNDSSRSKSREKLRDSVQTEKGMEKKHSSENTGSKPKDYSESLHSRVKEKVRDSAQGTLKGIDKKHDSKIRHFEKSHSKSKEDDVKKLEKRCDFGSTRSKSGEHSEHSRSKSKEYPESSRSKYKERTQENSQNNEKVFDRKHKIEKTLSKSMELSESSQSKSIEKGRASNKECEKGKLKKNDIQSVQSKSKDFPENVQAKCKEKTQGSEKGFKKANFEIIQSYSKDKVQDLHVNEKLEEQEIRSLTALSKPKVSSNEDVLSREKNNNLKNVAQYEEQIEIDRSNKIDERNKVETDRLGSQVETDQLGSQVETDQLGSQVETDQLGSQGATDQLGSQGATDQLGSQGATDQLGSQGATDQLGSQGATDQLGSRSQFNLQKDMKSKETVEEKDAENLELKEWHFEENGISDLKEKPETPLTNLIEGQNNQNDKKGIDIESSQWNSKESITETKEIADSTSGNTMEIENLIKYEDKLEERTETIESEAECINIMGKKEHEAVQKTGEFKTSLLSKEETGKLAHDQLTRPNEINIPLNMEQHRSLHTPYEAISPNTPTMNEIGLLPPITDKAQFVLYDPSSPATPTLDEDFCYEPSSSTLSSVVSSLEGTGKPGAHSSGNVAEELCHKYRVEKMDPKCEPSEEEPQGNKRELPVQQDVVSEINTSTICKWKGEDVTGESVKVAEEQSSSRRERKPKRPYSPVENTSKRRHLHSEEKSVVDEAELLQIQNEERPPQCQGKIASKAEEKTRNQTNDASSQSKPTTRAAKKISSPEHLSVADRERRSSTSAKEKQPTDWKAGKSLAPVTVTRSRNQPSPVTKQGRKREASPERKKRQHKTEVPPKRTRR
ncbi:biorientation of chromosomes in cell division protein 1-like 1 isoform X2 [Narcine bancroftii]|uniref:biorientation of chromosomes in cell division protein 1-like 1 isoform X2 n=1 Tax=Narcine bancroftii TaxID=1343680 RepID=UPI0038319E77